jgi:hypothetical protein
MKRIVISILCAGLSLAASGDPGPQVATPAPRLLAASASKPQLVRTIIVSQTLEATGGRQPAGHATVPPKTLNLSTPLEATGAR